jgi:hypothetical protein
MTERLHGSPNVVHELRAAIYQRPAGTDDGHMSLIAFAAVFERIEQPGIETSQASQVLKASISSVLRLLE